MILVVSVTSLPVQDVDTLLQCCILGAAISTAIQLYPIRIGSIQIGSGPPYMVGPTYVFLSTCLSTADSRRIPYIFGVRTAAGVVAVSYGTSLKEMPSFFSPMVTRTIVMTAGVPIFNPAISNTAGSTLSPDSGVPINWTIGVFVVLIVLGFNVLGKGFPKVAAIPVGMTTGYTLSVTLGLVSFSGIGEVTWLTFPRSFAFSVRFDLGCTLMFVLFYSIVAIQMMGNFNVSCMGGPDRESVPDEIGGGATTNGITSIISAAFNSFLTATHSRNSGIAALTKVCSRFVILAGCEILSLAGLCPKVGAVPSTISNCVIGGGIVVVFAMTTTSGIKLLTKADHFSRNCLTIGVSLVSGLGTQFCKGVSVQLPAGTVTMLEENNAILTSLLAIILSLVFPKDPVQTEGPTGKV